jgi:hypothetical protein
MKDSRRPGGQVSYSRRRFLRDSQVAVTALSAAPLLGNATDVLAPTVSSDSTNEAPDYYDKLGVTKIINAAGTYTNSRRQ